MALAVVAGIGFMASTSAKAEAQVGVEIGVAPECPYGYYDAAPYNCAPTGYYGPEWFNGDGFIGAGLLLSNDRWSVDRARLRGA
jgi:hypothetical protein